ncbi:MAG: hypothetical protein IPN59_14140 [Holophaga sp.]|nr:hypothetical protein [Holophaga sp.]
MFSQRHAFLRASLGLMLGFAAFQQLHAQLDTRLQSSKTDFMNLYQQSASLKAKPEILTVFDYSGSMSSLMFHPLYRNDDKDDTDGYRNMRFDLTYGATSPVVAPNNRYRIRAQAGNCTTAFAEYQVTVTSTGATGVALTNPASCPVTTAVTYNTAPTYTIQATAAGHGSAWAWVKFAPTSSGLNPSYSLTTNGHSGTQTNTLGSFTITHQNKSQSPAPVIEMSSTSGATGTTITLTTYLTHPLPPVQEPPLVDNTGINWSISNTGNLGTNPAGSLGSSTWSQVSVGLYKSVTTFVIPPYTPWTQPAGGDPTQLRPITVSPGTPFASGATLSFNTYFIQRGTTGAYDRINWSVVGVDTANQSCVSIPATSPTNNTGNTTSYQASKSVTWKIPAYQDPATCSTGGVATGSYVTITLEASKDTSYDSGITYVGTLKGNTLSTSTARSNGGSTSMGWLIKPDGTQVTQTDADNRSATSGLRGDVISPGSNDVRNWIRAASHVRFKYRVSSTPLVYRTIDIPIPWAITNRDSTGNPLSSQTVLDSQIKKGIDSNGLPISTTYGSGLQMELDQNYKVEGTARGTFTSDGYTASNQNPGGSALSTTVKTTAWLYSTVYKPSYVSWLFNGKYQSSDATKPNYTSDSSLVGKYIVFDAEDTSNVAGQTSLSWGKGYGPSNATYANGVWTNPWGNVKVPRYNLDGTYKDSVLDEASNYRIPSLTRVQAVKSAAIKTWINHQADVFWAFRCLDPYTEANDGDATQIDNDSTSLISASDATTTHVNGNDTGWMVLNNTAAQGITSTSGNSVKGMKRIANLFARGGTPLTYAMARSLAQYADPNSVFNAVVGADVSQCVGHYLLLFTDGLDNNATSTGNVNKTTPYIVGTGTIADPYKLNALKGNQAIILDKTSVDRYGSNWNLFNFAGIGAHLSDSTFGVKNTDYMAALDFGDPGAAVTSGKPSTFLPFGIKKRNGVTYDKDHRVTTMTVGVSLGGQYTDNASPKRSLFLAAVTGDPATKTGVLNDFHTFVGWDQNLQNETLDPNNDWIPDPQDPTSYPDVGKRKDGAVYFFDATDADKLIKSMDYAFKIAIGNGGNNATSSPNLPFVGASFGKQIYLGNFQPPKAGGVIWPGDLLMFGTREKNGKINLTDKAGNIADPVNRTTAIWSASDVLSGRLWSTRKLYTRPPLTAVGTEPSIKVFTDTGVEYSDNTTGLKNYVGVPSVAVGSAAQQQLIQNAAGGNINGALDATTGRPKTNRSNIMGDIINSAPAPLEYNWADVKDTLDSYSRLKAVKDLGGNRFRLILVGTNQGWLHAFGEVTRTTTVTDFNGDTQTIVLGDIEELWAFMPTDFLKELGYVYGNAVGSNRHRFMMDGTPAVYHLDMPKSTGGSGNGVVDSTERAIAVFGLRKGGRSYYALDIHDPFKPAMKWSLVPDEADYLKDRTITSGPSLSTIQKNLKNWGFSTATPAFGRITLDAIPRDAVFLSGGWSVPEVEANFPDTSSNPTPLGRSVMAVDVYSGKVLATADLTDSTIGGTTVGPVSAGIIPFEFVVNSGMAQRAYFMDYKGGLWAWGSKDVWSADPYKDFRVDTSELKNWKVRKVYQDDNSATSGLGARYTMPPAPFRVGYFPGVGKTGSASPSAVGIAMISGDRNNPLDTDYNATTDIAPVKHRLTLVFDRQDSRAWSLDTGNGPDAGIQDKNLKDFSNNKYTGTASPANVCSDSIFKYISPGCSDYYLAPAAGSPYFGYYINFPSMANKFLAKGINPPIVVAGSLFYSYFLPDTANPCTGGSGNTFSWFTADVMNPLVSDSRTSVASRSGQSDKWAGVASDYIALGTRAVLQGGTVPVSNPQPGESLTTPEVHTTQGTPAQRYPKPRVWRTVH